MEIILVLGVLGGMGPLATVDFLKKLIEHTVVDTDQQHIPMVVWSVPQIPDRSNHIVHGAESPFPELKKGLLALQLCGASVVAIPCNTAHYWYQDLINSTGMDLLHIADAVEYEISLLSFDVKSVGVLATTGTVNSSIYQNKLNESGRKIILPSADEQETVMEGIALVKSGRVNAAKRIFSQQIKRLQQQGAAAIVLGCTEIPAVVDEAPNLIDSNTALAKRCIRWYEATYKGALDDSEKDKESVIGAEFNIKKI